MNGFLLTLLDMSVVSSLLILAVVLLRLVFKKAPKAIICLLWALVGLRLICPISFESKLSLVPEKEPVTYIAEHSDIDKPVEEYVGENREVVSYETNQGSVIVTSQSSAEFDFREFFFAALPFVWGGGVFAMVLSSVISYVRLRKSMLACLNVTDNVYLCDGIKSPFILGLIRPKIYIPSHLSEEEQRVVIAHEKAHLRRLDHIWKPVGFAILTVHWFNPLVWVSYALLCRDIEGACDEYVVKKMNGEDKKLYSYTLLSCSAPRHMLAACPVAFGEVNVKGRVKSVLSYKKPAFWLIIASVVASIVVALLFMTNPADNKDSYKTPEELIHNVIMEEEKFIDPMYPGKDVFACESHYVFDTEELGNTKAYYLWVAYMEYTLEDGQLLDGGGGVGPKVITMTKAEDGSGFYELKEYWEPVDGEGYGTSIRAKFPAHLHDRVLHGTTQDYVLEETKKLAAEHFGVKAPTADPEQYPRFTGEILKVTDKHYLIAPTEGEIIMGQSIDKIYVYHGGEAQFADGDLVTVAYNKSIEDTNPPILGSINGISLIVENFRREAPASVDFYHKYDQKGSISCYALVDVTEDELKNIEIYKYTPASFFAEESLMISDYETITFNERFTPYLYINKANGLASFVYADGCHITGRFSEDTESLTVNYYDYAEYINGSGRFKLYFEHTDEGFTFNKKKSDFSKTYLFEVDGAFSHKLPDNAVFKNDYDLKAK